jgi:hypothetical protein
VVSRSLWLPDSAGGEPPGPVHAYGGVGRKPEREALREPASIR